MKPVLRTIKEFMGKRSLQIKSGISIAVMAIGLIAGCGAAEMDNMSTTDTEIEIDKIFLEDDNSGDLSEESVSDIAKVVATAVGDTSTDDIVIQDSEGTILFMQNTKTLAE